MALETLVWWNDGQPRLKVGVERSRKKVPVLEADTIDEVVLPWIKENWSEAVRPSEGYMH